MGWQGLASLKFNRWIPRAELIEQGFRKFVVEFDQHLATHALGNDARPLSKESIAGFLDDFGLEPEFTLHSHIRSLSGGCLLANAAVAVGSWKSVLLSRWPALLFPYHLSAESLMFDWQILLKPPSNTSLVIMVS